jgi:hypothetical protein
VLCGVGLMEVSSPLTIAIYALALSPRTADR